MEFHVNVDCACHLTIKFMSTFSCRIWKVEQEQNPSIPQFQDKVKVAMESHPLDVTNTDEMDCLLLCSKPS
jgi:hypothetical protein